MKPAILSTMLGLTTGFGLILCGCRALPGPDASFSPFYDNDEQYPVGEPVANPGQDLAVPASPGTVRTVNEPWRTIEGAPSGRVRLLEMYQTAVAQRDRTALRAANAERERDEALAQAAEAEKKRVDLEARNAGLSTELRELHTKALELARRLAQAELSRLETEKAELEVRTSDGARSRAR